MLIDHTLQMSTGKMVCVAATQHFDIVWRRPVSHYRSVQANVIKRVLQIIDRHPDFRFSFQQANVLRYFVEHNPEDAQILKKRVREGSIEILGGIEAIPDTNLITGESLLRNIIYGKQWVLAYFGTCGNVGSLLDCFGSSGQIPQVFAGTGHEALVPGRMPNAEFSAPGIPSLFKWSGIDGTVIKGIHLAFDAIPAEIIGGWYGWGTLEGCDHKEPNKNEFIESIHQGIDAIASRCGSPKSVLAVVAGEEHLPKEDVVDAVLNFERDDESRIYFVTFSEFLGDVDWERDADFLDGEYNVEFSGCYTSRIQLKQRNQAVEIALYNAELLHSLLALRGKTPPNPELMKGIWRDLFVAQFHDSICGCHIDDNYRHIVGVLNSVQQRATAQIENILANPAGRPENKQDSSTLLVFNSLPYARRDVVRVTRDGGSVRDSHGNPVPSQRDGEDLVFLADLDATSARTYHISSTDCANAVPKTLPSSRILMGNYAIREVDGNLELTDIKRDRSLFSQACMPARIVLKEDVGTLWTEEFTGSEWREYSGSSKLESIDVGDLFASITYTGDVERGQVPWSSFGSLRWRKIFYVYRYIDRIDVHLDLDFHGCGTEVSIIFPINVDPFSARARYEIPFGSMYRQKYPDGKYKYGHGNWPAVSWCDYSDSGFGVTLAHSGTPGCLASDGKVSFSLLRSGIACDPPQFPTVPEPLSFDNGPHHYEFALIPHDARDRDWLRLARGFVARPLVSQCGTSLDPFLAGTSLSIGCPNVVLSALKPSEDGRGVIIRVYETLGEECETSIRLGEDNLDAVEVTMDESREVRPLDLDRIKLRAYEIKTIKIALDKCCQPLSP